MRYKSFLSAIACLLLSVIATGSLALADDLSKAATALHADIKKHPEWNFHSLLVSRDGQPILEEYYQGSDQKWGRSLGTVSFGRETLHDLRSVTKSVVSVLIGIAIRDGHIKSIDQPLSDFFPEYKLSGEKAKLTLRHVLTMSTGLAWDEMSTLYSDPSNDSYRIVHADDPAAFVLERPLVSAPGEKFNYSGGSTEVLAGILQRATKTTLHKYFEDKLWLPLGGSVNDYEWGGRKRGLPSAEFGLRLRPADLMKFGNLIANRGKYQGKQIVPAEWIAEISKNQVKSVPEFLAMRFAGYGYQWWLPQVNGAEDARVFAAIGNGGQIVLIFPKQQMVIVMMAGRYNTPNTVSVPLIEKHIIPYIKPVKPASAEVYG